MIRWKQSIDGMADWGLRFNNPDFPAYARAYGANGRQIRSASELVPALEEAFSAGGVHLVSAAIDYSENRRLRVDDD
jgi:acetolactate synthase-1/2/3 large subunit